MKRFSFYIFLFIIPLFFLGVTEAKAATQELIKASQPTVYYSYDGKRYAFPNEQVYFSWYKDFSNVKTVSDAELASQPLAGNVTFNVNQFVKITTDPKVYVVSSGNSLQWVQTEDMAKTLLGADWAKKVKDISDAQFQDYVVADPWPENRTTLPPGNYDAIARSILSAQTLAEQTGSQDAFPIPPSSTVTEVTKYGFEATTTMSEDETAAWFASNITGTNLYDDSKSITTGTETYVIRFMNTGLSANGSFEHRSWEYISAPGFNVIGYSDIPFPQGFISYPRAVNRPEYEYHAVDRSLSYQFDTLDSMDDIIAWYNANGPKNGWTVTPNQLLSDPSGMMKSLYLKNEHQGLEIIIGINETGVSRIVDVVSALIGTYVPVGADLSKLPTPIEFGPVVGGASSTAPTENQPPTSTPSNPSTSSTNFLPIPPGIAMVHDASQYGYDATTTMSTDELMSWFTSGVNGMTLLYDATSTDADNANITFINYGASTGDSFTHRSFTISESTSTSYRTIDYQEITFPKGFIAYPRGVGFSTFLSAPGTYTHSETNDTVEYLFMTTDSKDQVLKWYQDTAPKYGWHVVSVANRIDPVTQEVSKVQLENTDKTSRLYLDWLDGFGPQLVVSARMAPWQPLPPLAPTSNQ